MSNNTFTDLTDAIERATRRTLGQESRIIIWDAATDGLATTDEFFGFVSDYASITPSDDDYEAIVEAFLAFREVTPLRWPLMDDRPTDAMIRDDEAQVFGDLT